MKFTTLFLISLMVVQALSSNVAMRLKAKVEQVPAASSSLSADYIPGAALQGSESSAALIANSASAVAPASASLAAPSSASAVMASSAMSSVAALSQSVAASASTATTPAPGSVPASASSASASASSASSGSSNCQSQQPCMNLAQEGDVDDAVKPITDWLKNFKSRTNANSGDLRSAAKATVAPLIAKLKRNQEAAIEKIQDSNAAILQHVEQQTTEHIYNLLKKEQATSDQEDSAMEKKQKVKEAKAIAAEKKLISKLMSEESSEESSEGSSRSRY